MTDTTRQLCNEVRQYLRSNKDMLDDLTRDALHDLDVAYREMGEIAAAAEVALQAKDAELAAAQATVAQQQKLFGVFTPCPNCDGSGKDARGSGCCRIPGHSTECACLVCQWMNGWYRLSRDNDELHAALDASQDRVAQLQEKCEKIPGYVSEAEAHRTLLMERDNAIAQQGAVIAAMREALDDLHKTVKGECPSLLDEDSGGNARLDLKVESVLSRTAQLAADHDAAVRADERRKVLEAVDAEEELPDDMPDEMWDHIRNDRDAIKEALLIAVQLTKGNIRERIEQLAAQPEEGR